MTGVEIGVIVAVVSIVSTIASLVIQLTTKPSKPNAEARAGFEIVVEGTPKAVPKVYGRCLVGGVRVFHRLWPYYIHAYPNSDKQLMANGCMMYSQWSDMTLPLSFLYFQQILCQGEIHAIRDVIIDDTGYFADARLNTAHSMLASKVTPWIKAGLSIDLHYGHPGGRPDNCMIASNKERDAARFEGMAYLSAIIKLDEDEPQFGGVPSLQPLVEGSLVRTVTAGVLSEEYVYSNNPAFCLLDYLLDTICGKGLSLSELNLTSFEEAATICDKIVQHDLPVGGKIWQPTDGKHPSGNYFVNKRDIPLYECNIIIDTEKPIRDNVESIMSTMGDARLIWSGGVYSLKLQYPTSNDEVDVAMIITDADITNGMEIAIKWPDSSFRFNYCICKFHNEHLNFKEDSVCWPPKYNRMDFQNIGGYFGQIVDGASTGDSVGHYLLGKYGTNAFSSSWGVALIESQFMIPRGMQGEYTFKCSIGLPCNGSTFALGISTIYGTAAIVGETEFIDTVRISHYYLGSPDIDCIYQIDLWYWITGGWVGAIVENNNGYMPWNSRMPMFNQYYADDQSNAIYLAMLAEDEGLKLETEIFAEGITDPYHAKAKAEELVRTSRSAFSISFDYIVKNNFLEPCDFIRIDSDILNLGHGAQALYFKVDSIKLAGENSCTVAALRFDYTQLAWSNKHVYTPPIIPSNLFVTNLVFNRPTDETYSGTLTWTGIENYPWHDIVIFTNEDGTYDSLGNPIFRGLATWISGEEYKIDLLPYKAAMFGVSARAGGIAYTGWCQLWGHRYVFTDLVFTVEGTTLLWSASHVSIDNAFPIDVPEGSATWESDTLFIYYDIADNLIKATLDVEIAMAGYFIRTFVGSEEFNETILEPPLIAVITGTTGQIFNELNMSVSWLNNPANTPYLVNLKDYIFEIAEAKDITVFDPGNPTIPIVIKPRYVVLSVAGTSNIVYSYDQLLIDFDILIPSRNILIKIYSRDGTNNLSSPLAINFTNPAPAKITDEIYVLDGRTVTFTSSQLAATDKVNLIIAASSSQTFNPEMETSWVYKGAPNSPAIFTLSDTGDIHWVRCALSDSYSSKELNWSDPVNLIADIANLGPPSNLPVLGAIVVTTVSSFGTVDITANWTYTQGTIKAEGFILYMDEGTSNPTLASPVSATLNNLSVSYIWRNIPVDKSFKMGIAAYAKYGSIVETTAIVVAWTRTGILWVNEGGGLEEIFLATTKGTIGTIDMMVTSVVIPPGTYVMKSTIGCSTSGATATLNVKDQDNVLITSIAKTGIPTMQTSSPFTLTAETLLDFILNCNQSDDMAVVEGIHLEEQA